MKAALISLGSISSKWTAEAMKKYFDSVDSLDIRKIEINIGAKKDARLLYDRKPLEKYDCIFAKGSFRYAALLRAVTSFLQKDSYMPIQDNAFTLVHNKLLTHIVLQQTDIPMPITYLTPTALSAKIVLKKVNYPIVIKFPEGTQGKGVMFAESFAAASSILDALQTLKQPIIIQEYVETGSTDIRAIVIGSKVVAAMQRIAVHGEKRANIHAGGLGEAVELDTHTKKIAIKAAKAMGAEICGVDILQGVKGPMVIELNISPGLQGIKKATGIDVANHIAKHLLKKTKDRKKVEVTDGKKNVLEDLGIDDSLKNGNEICFNLDLRANRILLPDIATKLSNFDENQEVCLTVKKDEIIIKKL